jgi:hypothetical protein
MTGLTKGGEDYMAVEGEGRDPSQKRMSQERKRSAERKGV